MGRRVYESGEFVWKYVFGVQPSEQYRIAKEFGIGSLTYDVARVLLDKNGNVILDEYGDEAYENVELTEEEYENEDCFACGDILHLTSNDISKLINIYETMPNYKKAKELETKMWEGNEHGISFSDFESGNKKIFKICPDYYFARMVEQFVEYMEYNPKDHYYFEGEM